MMKVLLLSCYELGHQPFNLASPAAWLEAAGFDVSCQDLSVESLNETTVCQADLIGFSTPMHTALRLAVEAAKQVKEINPEAMICFYGLYAGMQADVLLTLGNGRPLINAAIGGEFEAPLVGLASALRDGRSFPVAGVRSRQFPDKTALDRQSFRETDRKRLPGLSHYAKLQIGPENRLAGYVQASRGCAHKCRHCPITPVYEGRVRIIQAQVVLSDIAQLADLGAQHITFGDPDFLNGVKHSRAIAEEMHRLFPQLTFDFTAKIEHLLQYRELLPLFQELGCIFIVSAVELLNDRILAYLDKGHTRADVEKAVQLMENAGIALRPSLMPFTPWSALDDIIEIFEFVEEHELFDRMDPIQYSIRLLLPPGSALLTHPKLQPFLGDFDQSTFSYHWSHPDSRMDTLQSKMSDLTEEATCGKQDRFELYTRLRRLVYETAKRDPARSKISQFRRKQYAPRLTEDWFC